MGISDFQRFMICFLNLISYMFWHTEYSTINAAKHASATIAISHIGIAGSIAVISNFNMKRTAKYAIPMHRLTYIISTVNRRYLMRIFVSRIDLTMPKCPSNAINNTGDSLFGININPITAEETNAHIASLYCFSHAGMYTNSDERKYTAMRIVGSVAAPYSEITVSAVTAAPIVIILLVENLFIHQQQRIMSPPMHSQQQSAHIRLEHTSQPEQPPVYPPLAVPPLE